MCGRYVMALRAGELVDALESCGLDEVDAMGPRESWRRSWNLAPTSSVPILVQPQEVNEGLEDTTAPRRRQLHAARWGLLPVWAESASFSSRTFNARSETVVTKPSFRSAVRTRRCAVPAQGYYEWQVTTDETSGKTVRTPHYIHPADGSVMLFAGLYEWWKDPQRAAAGEDPWVLSTTILTGPSPEVTGAGTAQGGSARQGAASASASASAPARLGALHDRLPLAMTPEITRRWIRPGESGEEEMQALVATVAHQALEVTRGWDLHVVDRAVGNVRNDSQDLIRPVEPLF